MRNLSRTLSLAAALTLTALTAQAGSGPYGTCLIRCYGAGSPPPSYTVAVTQVDCCWGNVPNQCPAGGTPVAIAWNGSRCAPS